MKSSDLYRLLREENLTHDDFVKVSTLLNDAVKEANELKMMLKKIKTKQEAVERDIIIYKAIIAPIRRLHTDILREIFMQCLPKSTYPSLSCKTAPMLLGHVCSAWRSVSRTTPSLWASLYIKVPDVQDNSLQERMVEEWLQRSGVVPLSLSLTMSLPKPALYNSSATPSNIFTASPFKDMIKVILRHSSRWKDIDLIGNSQQILSISESCLSNLTCLKLRFVMSFPARHTFSVLPEPIVPIPPTTFEWLFQAKNLTEITLRDINANPLELPLHWDQLTYLDLGVSRVPGTSVFQAYHAAEILRRCPSLEHCAFQLWQSDNTEDMDFQMVSLPALKSLQISTSLALPHLDIFFSSLYVPALHELTFSETSIPGTGLQFMVQEAQETTMALRKLVAPALENVSLLLNARFDMQEYLCENPSVKYLKLRQAFGMHLHLTGLGAPFHERPPPLVKSVVQLLHDDDELYPDLEMLDISNPCEQDEGEFNTLFFEMVRRRKGMKEVWMCFSLHLAQEEEEKFRVFEKEMDGRVKCVFRFLDRPNWENQYSRVNELTVDTLDVYI